MSRRLTDDERSLWERVATSVRKFGRDQTLPVPTTPVSPGFNIGTIPFNPVLDLHGMTLNGAHRAALDHIYNARLQSNCRYVTIITGLSGQICEEFPRWFDNHLGIRSIKSLHGGGAWELWLTRNVI